MFLNITLIIITTGCVAYAYCLLNDWKVRPPFFPAPFHILLGFMYLYLKLASVWSCNLYLCVCSMMRVNNYLYVQIFNN